MTTPKDFDRLSAYLDGQVSPGEKAAVEARLANEPDLQTALADLRLTVRALRALPTLKPPRSYALTRAQADALVPRRRPFFPALRLAAALSALALTFTIAGDLVGRVGLLAAPSPQVEVAAVSDAGTATEQALAAEQPPAATAAPEATHETEIAVESFASVAPSPTAEAAGDASQAPATEAPAGGVGGEAATAEPTPAAEVGLAPLPATPTASAERVAEATTSKAAAEPTQTTEAQIDQSQAPSAEPALQPGLSPLRVAQLALAALTLLLGLAAWLARRAP